MERRLRLSSSGEFVEEEFYEEIEAPTFVDLTLKDPFRPDDRYWFCSRVGCDEKHLEEIDSEEIYKKFVLRVMAARSPNVKLRKVLSRKNASDYKKCPQSAPPKHSKPWKLTVTSSISRKLFDNKDKRLRVNIQAQPTNTSSCSSSTPKCRGKQVAAKYMTTPRRITKPRFDPATFRSAGNTSRTGGDTLPKTASSTAVKTLSFNIEKKPTRPKATAVDDQSSGGHTPVTKLCERMKKLDLSSQRKLVKPAIISTSKINIKIQHQSHSKDILKNGKEKGNSRIKKQVRFAPCEDDHEEGRYEDPPHKVTPFPKSRKWNTRDAQEEAALCPEETSIPKSPYVGNQNDEPTSFADEDKENAPTSEVCSSNNNNNHRIGTTNDDNIMVAKITGKKQEATVGKYKKPKLTNPKPFRLRTDERGILKEATMGRKIKNNPHEDATENLPRRKGGVLPQSKDRKYISTVLPLKEKGLTKTVRIPFSQKRVQKLPKREELKPDGVCSTEVENLAPHVNLKEAGGGGRDDKFLKTRPKDPNFLHVQKTCTKLVSWG